LLLLTPIFEADLPENAWGYRPGRSALGAVEQVHKSLRAGYTEVVDADLRQYFELIPHAELMRSVARRGSDSKVLALIKAWLQAPVVVQDARGRERRRGGKEHHRGMPQGGVISPLLANLYMGRFLLAWQKWERQLEARVCNYADDLVILCKGTAEMALVVTRDLLKRLKLELNEEKTRLVDARTEHFDFLGYPFGPQYDPRDGACYSGVVPSQARIRRLRETVRRHLRLHNQPVEEVIVHLNRLLAGWARYFSYGTVSRTHRMIDCYVADRLRQFLVRQHKLGGQGTRQFPERRLYREYGLLRLESSRAW
jgi:RNA-directed DNA polymerase